MVDSVYCLTNLLYFGTPLLYYYINLRSWIIFCLFLIYILLWYFFIKSYIFGFTFNCLWTICDEVFHSFWPVASVVFWIVLFWRSFKCICVGLFRMIKTIYHLSFYLHFYRYSCSYFKLRTKICNVLQLFDL